MSYMVNKNNPDIYISATWAMKKRHLLPAESWQLRPDKRSYDLDMGRKNQKDSVYCHGCSIINISLYIM